jgi:hypothetical protein
VPIQKASQSTVIRFQLLAEMVSRFQDEGISSPVGKNESLLGASWVVADSQKVLHVYLLSFPPVSFLVPEGQEKMGRSVEYCYIGARRRYPFRSAGAVKRMIMPLRCVWNEADGWLPPSDKLTDSVLEVRDSSEEELLEIIGYMEKFLWPRTS